MMIAKMNGKRVSKLVEKNKSESPIHNLGETWLTEMVLATP
ncbi:hypothetical protein [Sporosarcina sp. FSL K6-2383]